MLGVASEPNPHVCPTTHLLYLLYWYKCTNTDAAAAGVAPVPNPHVPYNPRPLFPVDLHPLEGRFVTDAKLLVDEALSDEAFSY